MKIVIKFINIHMVENVEHSNQEWKNFFRVFKNFFR